MSLLSSNYEVLQLSADEKGGYVAGQIFMVPARYRHNWRFMKFDGLEIRAISYGLGVFLHFNFHEWSANNPPTENVGGATFKPKFY